MTTVTAPRLVTPSWGEMLEGLRRSAHLGPSDDADRAARATLAALAQRVPESLSRTLVTRLPHDIGSHLKVSDGTQSSYADDLVAEVAEAAGLDALRAAKVARVIFGVVDRATSGALCNRASTSLPEDVRDLVLSASRRP